MEERNLQKVVWLSEDFTRITGKIEYDVNTNKVVGFVMPLVNGLPKRNAFLAKTAKDIEGYVQNSTKADYAHVIMAQPLGNNSPSFCVAVFGTDNKFTYEDVIQRWQQSILQASHYGIKILGFYENSSWLY